jgi:2-haloacid dehalogenase
MERREALAFDVYGTLVDPIRIDTRLERFLGPDATAVAEAWRRKQLEYTFRLAAMQRYEDFAEVTRKALVYALAAAGRSLDPAQQEALLAQYNDLECFPDAVPGLQRLAQAGHTLVVCSNGTPAMLEALLGNAGLRGYFRALVSVDEVRAFKPAPQVYHHLARRLGRPPGAVRLVSSNPFDVLGAQAAGMPTVWLDRSGGLFDTLGPPPAVVVRALTELAGALPAP